MILCLLDFFIRVRLGCVWSRLVQLSSLELNVNVFLELILGLFQVFVLFWHDFHSAFWHCWYFLEVELWGRFINFDDFTLVAINELLSTDQLDEFVLGGRIWCGLELDTFEKLLFFLKLIFLLFFLQSELFNKLQIAVFLFNGALNSNEPFLIVVFCVKFPFRSLCRFHKTLDYWGIPVWSGNSFQRHYLTLNGFSWYAKKRASFLVSWNMTNFSRHGSHTICHSFFLS